jgi:hypothetical protein
MPDLLAHAFLAYSIGRVLSWRWDWITTPYVTLAMVGAFIPDLTKIKLVVPAGRVNDLLGIPFDWGSLHTGGGVVLSVLIGVALLSTDVRRRGSALLAIGAGSHLFADSLLLTPTKHTQQLFWPLHQYQVPSPGLYLSTQPEPTIVTGCLAAAVWGVHSIRTSKRD